jgi:putative restriction endonuclease
MPGPQGVVALTDERWHAFLRSISVGDRLDEVNFWRPLARSFKSLTPGGPFFFRLKAPVNAIVGYGYFVAFELLPIREAWNTFGQKNGDAAIEGFIGRIAEYRGETPAEAVLSGRPVGCIVLREVRFLSREEWVPWAESEGFSPNIMTYKRYDLASPAGSLLQNLLRNGQPVELAPGFVLQAADDRLRAETTMIAMEGQGAFRVRVLDAYGMRCAVTGERSLPVLDAAHIQPYLGPASNHVQNGLSLRADLHRLFDAGYVTVTPGHRFLVSRRLREDFENGRGYYQLDGQGLLVVPDRPETRPSADALEWHANHIYRG